MQIVKKINEKKHCKNKLNKKISRNGFLTLECKKCEFKKFVCLFCGKELAFVKNLKSHTLNHLKKYPLRNNLINCIYCDKKLPFSVEIFNIHLVNHFKSFEKVFFFK